MTAAVSLDAVRGMCAPCRGYNHSNCAAPDACACAKREHKKTVGGSFTTADETVFRCADCDFKAASPNGLAIHRGRSHGPKEPRTPKAAKKPAPKPPVRSAASKVDLSGAKRALQMRREELQDELDKIEAAIEALESLS